MKKLLKILTIILFSFCEKSAMNLNAQVCFNPITNYTAGTVPYSVISSDFNGDSKIDLAVTNYGGNNISVLLGTGLGTFGTPSYFAIGTATNPVGIMSA